MRQLGRRFTTMACGAGLIATLLAATAGSAPARPAPAGPRAPTTASDGGEAKGLVVGGDAKTREVLVLDAGRPTWDPDVEPDAVRWTWKPTEDNGYGDVLDGWEEGSVSDARVRRGGPGQLGGSSVLVTAEYGFAAAVSYPSGKRLWATDVPQDCDDGESPCGPHAAELLPDGNVAVAASIGDWVRVYTASQGPDSTDHAEFELNGAHGALWDPERDLLWAVGTNDLVALEVGGTPSEPTLTEVERVALPGEQGGHDLAPVYGDTDKLWITTNALAYQYSKSDQKFTTAFPEGDQINEDRLTKSIGNHPETGQMLVTHAKKFDCPTTWCTPTAEFFGADDLDATRTRPDAQFYKLRWWAPQYQ